LGHTEWDVGEAREGNATHVVVDQIEDSASAISPGKRFESDRLPQEMARDACSIWGGTERDIGEAGEGEGHTCRRGRDDLSLGFGV